jgi:hypothetical protein
MVRAGRHAAVTGASPLRPPAPNAPRTSLPSATGCRSSGPGANKVHRVLSQVVVALAVEDSRPALNAAAGVSLPPVTPEERQYMTHTGVERLAEACAASPGEPVRKQGGSASAGTTTTGRFLPLLDYIGVRLGEMAHRCVRGSRPAGSERERPGEHRPSRELARCPRQDSNLRTRLRRAIRLVRRPAAKRPILRLTCRYVVDHGWVKAAIFGRFADFLRTLCGLVDRLFAT